MYAILQSWIRLSDASKTVGYLSLVAEICLYLDAFGGVMVLCFDADGKKGSTQGAVAEDLLTFWQSVPSCVWQHMLHLVPYCVITKCEWQEP